MVEETEVREKLLDVLQDNLPVEEFADWLSVAQTNMHLDSTREAQALVSKVSLFLSEYFDGALTESRLTEELTALVNRAFVSIEVPGAGARYVMSGGSVSQRPLTRLALQV